MDTTTARPSLTITLAAALAGAIVAIICLSAALIAQHRRPPVVVRQVVTTVPTPGPDGLVPGIPVCPQVDAAGACQPRPTGAANRA